MTDDAPQRFHVTLEPEGAALRIVVSGELDIATVPELQRHVSSDGTAEAVALDLTGVTFIDSTGLRLLLETYRTIGDRLQIVPSAACERLFDIAGVRDHLPLVKT